MHPMMLKLLLDGVIRVVRPGKAGHNSTPTVYRTADAAPGVGDSGAVAG